MRIVRRGKKYALKKGYWLFARYKTLDSCPLRGWVSAGDMYFSGCWGSPAEVGRLIAAQKEEVVSDFETLIMSYPGDDND